MTFQGGMSVSFSLTFGRKTVTKGKRVVPTCQPLESYPSSPPPPIRLLKCADQLSNKNHFLSRTFQPINRIMASCNITLFNPFSCSCLKESTKQDVDQLTFLHITSVSFRAAVLTIAAANSIFQRAASICSRGKLTTCVAFWTLILFVRAYYAIKCPLITDFLHCPYLLKHTYP